MADETQVVLRYLGPDVDDGSIGVDDLMSALNGFSSAFYKVAERVDIDRKQRIKVSGISQSSANIHLSILQLALEYPKTAAAAVSGVAYVGKKIADVVIDRISETRKGEEAHSGRVLHGRYNQRQ